MNYLKKHWYLVVVTLLTIGLAVMVILTSGKLSQTEQVTPTESWAAASACTLKFDITIGTPSPTPTGTITPTPTPTGTPTPTPTDTPTPTPAPTDTPTPTLEPTWTPVPTWTPYPTATPTPGQQIVYVSPTTTALTQVQVAQAAACNSSCTLNTDCAAGLVCIGGACRNPSCTSQGDCICVVAAAAPTPKIPVSGSGLSILGASIIGSALLILLLGLAL